MELSTSRQAVVLAGTAAGLACCASWWIADGLPCEEQSLQRLERELAERGVCTIEGVYSAAQIDAFTAQHDRLFEQHLAVAAETKSPQHRTYIQPGAAAAGGPGEGMRSVPLEVDVYDLPDGDELIRVAPGRVDFCSGMDAGIFGQSSFHEPPAVAALMRRLLKNSYTHYAGALPSVTESADGPWHRDTYDLFDDFDRVDCALPPFYFNVLIPLVDLTIANGAT